MEWIGEIPDGDPLALARLIWQEHPGYAADPSMTREEIQRRVSEMSRTHRIDDGRPRGDRHTQKRIAEL